MKTGKKVLTLMLACAMVTGVSSIACFTLENKTVNEQLSVKSMAQMTSKNTLKMESNATAKPLSQDMYSDAKPFRLAENEYGETVGQVEGTITEAKNGVFVYKIELEQNGYLEASFAGEGEGISESDYRAIKVRLTSKHITKTMQYYYDGSRPNIYFWNESSPYVKGVYLYAGTYYLECDTSSFKDINFKYTINAEFTPVEDNTNGSIGKQNLTDKEYAMPITLSTVEDQHKYNAIFVTNHQNVQPYDINNMANNGTQNWYKLELKKDTNITVVTKITTLGIEKFERLNLRIYNHDYELVSSGSQFAEIIKLPSGTWENISLSAGTYYIKYGGAVGDYTTPSSPCVYSFYIYDSEKGDPFKVEPITEPETEPITEPETEPITEVPTEPGTEPITEPDTEPETEPITELPTGETEPDTEPDTEPTDPTPVPPTELPTFDPIPEPTPAPTQEPTTDPRKVVPTGAKTPLAAIFTLIASSVSVALLKKRRKNDTD